MNSIAKVCAIGLVVFFLGGCASTSSRGGSQSSTGTQGGYEYDTRGGVDSYGYGPDSGITGQPVTGGGIGPAGVSGRIVFFEFDSAVVRPEARPFIEGHARYLVGNPDVVVLLEGHTDERGTREYNIGLGERRGDAVRRLMIAFGVAPQQITVVSYGEERPAALGQYESSYAQNRRVEIVY